jgi:hypothetical protein
MGDIDVGHASWQSGLISKVLTFDADVQQKISIAVEVGYELEHLKSSSWPRRRPPKQASSGHKGKSLQPASRIGFYSQLRRVLFVGCLGGRLRGHDGFESR